MKLVTKLPFLATFALAMLTIATRKGYAQESSVSTFTADTLNGKIESVKTDLELLKRLKITGYIQAQWQLADTAGSVTPFSGGAFP